MSELIALSELLLSSAQLIQKVMAGQSMSALLPTVPVAQRAGVQAISFYGLRYWSRGQVLSGLLLSKKAPNPLFSCLLNTSLCLLSASAFPNDENTPVYEEHTLVNQAVLAASKHKKTQAFKGLLNACLRRYVREKATLNAQVADQETVRYGFPAWWIQQLKTTYPTDWSSLLDSANQTAPLCLRVNPRQTTRQDYWLKLQEAGIKAMPMGRDAIVLPKPTAVPQLPDFERGAFSVQGLAAQQALYSVPLFNGARVLDACAAPGGKTAHFLEHFDLDMTVMDIEPKRLERVHENLTRLGLLRSASTVRFVQGDACDRAWYDGSPFDVVVADVPCTASGIVRRHPDIKWLRQPADVEKTAALQRAIVQNLWGMVKGGGYLLYITCSVFEQEGALQAAYLEGHLLGARRLPALGQLLPLVGQVPAFVGCGGQMAQDGELSDTIKAFSQHHALHDGFFYALFRKQTF